MEEIISRFNTLYLGDSIVEAIELRTAAAECHLTFNAGKVLTALGASIFHPAATYAPAQLLFLDVRMIAFDKSYQLNSTVVDCGATSTSEGEYVEFYFDFTGGFDADGFLVRMKILAKDFRFGERRT